MPRTCTICRHPERAEIDRALIAGEASRVIARHTAVSRDAVFRHSQHLSLTLVKSHEAAEITHADSLLDQLQELQADARRIKRKAEADKDYRSALAGVRELVRIVEVMARISGEIEERTRLAVAIVKPVEEMTCEELTAELERIDEIERLARKVLPPGPDRMP